MPMQITPLTVNVTPVADAPSHGALRMRLPRGAVLVNAVVNKLMTRPRFVVIDQRLPPACLAEAHQQHATHPGKQKDQNIDSGSQREHREADQGEAEDDPA